MMSYKNDDFPGKYITPISQEILKVRLCFSKANISISIRRMLIKLVLEELGTNIWNTKRDKCIHGKGRYVLDEIMFSLSE